MRNWRKVDRSMVLKPPTYNLWVGGCGGGGKRGGRVIQWISGNRSVWLTEISGKDELTVVKESPMLFMGVAWKRWIGKSLFYLLSTKCWTLQAPIDSPVSFKYNLIGSWGLHVVRDENLVPAADYWCVGKWGWRGRVLHLEESFHPSFSMTWWKRMRVLWKKKL